MTPIGRTIVGLFLALLAAPAPAFADIKAFNEAVGRRDFRAATAEAAATWPQLDKSRPDIGVIAREFGFAAYVAGDNAAAKTYASFVVDGAGQDAQRTVSLVLLRLAEMKMAPSREARDRLAEALTARAAEPGLDNISYLAADSLVGYDFEAGRWSDAQTSAELAAKLTEPAGADFLDRRRRFQLFSEAAEYMRTKDKQPYEQLVAVNNAIVADIDGAASDAAAAKLIPVFWEARAWAMSMESHLRSRRIDIDPVKSSATKTLDLGYPKRAVVPHDPADKAVCPTKLEFAKEPRYPASAMFQGFVGTVIVKVDIDVQGRASNPVVLSAVPEKHFGKAVMDSVDEIRVKAASGYDTSKCSLERKERVINYIFTFRAP